MKMKIVNSSATHADKDIYVCFLGQNTSGDYGYLALPEDLMDDVASGDDAKMAFVTATATDQKNANTVPSYTLEKLKSLSSDPTLSDYVNSGRGYLSIGSALDIPIWTKGYVGPAFMVDTNFTMFDFFEFFFDPSGTPNCNADLSPLDWISIPMSMEFDDAKGATVAGPVGFDVTRAVIFSDFSGDATFKNLIVKDAAKNDVRILAPGHGITNGLFSATYLDTYIDTVWTHYTTSGNTLALNKSPVNDKIYTGAVNASNEFVFTDTSGVVASTISKPTTQDVFLCNGAFNGVGSGTAFQIDANIKNQVVSALNRGILPLAAGAKLCDSANFYVTTSDNGGLYNGFSHKLHENSDAGLCYGFAYDDQCDQSSDVSVNNPDTFKVTILSFTAS